MLASVASQLGHTVLALSVLTLLELAHGAARADTSGRRSIREQMERIKRGEFDFRSLIY
jgi:predicted nucleic acid-binding protein